MIGISCLVAAIVDLFWTTLRDDNGTGPLSSRLITAVWHRLRSPGNERGWVLSLGGPLILALNLLAWVGLIWLG